MASFGNVPITITFASWEVFGFIGGGISPLVAATTNQISSAFLQRGSGLASGPTGTIDAWGGNGFNSTDLTSAIIGGDFFTATIALPSTSVFSFSRISANNIRKSATGASILQWQYSTDGIVFSDIGLPINLLVDGGSGNNIPEINLSSVTALQNLSNLTITFRLVGYGALASGGTLYFNDIPGKDLEIIGTYN